MLELPPLSLYIHIPWCIRKCPYCDFNSHQANGTLPEKEYVDTLLRDLQEDLDYIQQREIQSIFIGGGTPSLFSAAAYNDLLSGIARVAHLSTDLECTLEANPGSVEARRFTDFRKAGINRLSIGIQSFSDIALQALGRVHNADQGKAAIRICREAGIENFNLDIMYGLPAQAVDSAYADLKTAVDFQPDHISWYQLTIEPNTGFYSKPPVLPTEEVIMDTQDGGLELLKSAGYRQYEVSAFAREGRQSRHNLNYWNFGDYIGIGAGAHGKITLPEHNCILRTRKVRQPRQYLEKDVRLRVEETVVNSDERTLEFMMNVLRLTDGFDNGLYEQRTGNPFCGISKRIESLEQKGFLETGSSRIIPTGRGRLFVNTVLEEFL